MLCYQLTFIARDNIASYLSEGAPTALTYGWMIQQVPETLIGTAIGTALLPTISELFARNDKLAYRETIDRVERVLIALAIPIAVVLSLTLRPFLDLAFGFDAHATQQLLWVTRGFLVGLLGHCLLELGARVFFSQQNAIMPLIAAVLNLGIFVVLGKVLSTSMDVAGVALADSIAFTIQAVFLLIIFFHREKKSVREETIRQTFNPLSTPLKRTILRTLIGSAVAAGSAWFVMQHSTAYSPLIQGMSSFLIGMMVILPFIWKELRVFLHL